MSKRDSPAVWFFVGAVFILTLPRMGEGQWFPGDLWISTAAGIILTVLGFWFMLRGDRSSSRRVGDRCTNE